MTATEGIIQYRLDYRPGDLPPGIDTEAIDRWFRHCRERALIGRDPDRYAGFAFGNLSVRAAPGFVISGTQTGGLARLRPDDLAWVIDCDAAANRLSASGRSRPSSEAMTHGELYRLLDRVAAVIHGHSPEIWHQADRLGLPQTPAVTTYGTPEMATQVATLAAAVDPLSGVLTMGGHEDGIVAYGASLDQAGELLLAIHDRALAVAGR